MRIDKAKGSCTTIIRKCEKEFAEQLKSSLEQIIIDIENIRLEFNDLKLASDISNYEEISQSYGLLTQNILALRVLKFQNFSELKDKIDMTSELCRVLNIREGIVGLPNTDFKHLELIKREFSDYCKLWFYIRDFNYHEPVWLRSNLSDIDGDNVKNEVELYITELKRMQHSVFKENLPALTLTLSLQQKVNEFSPFVRLLKSLKSNGIRDRH